MSAAATKTTTSWADASEDSDRDFVDKDGFKYVTEYITRDNKKFKVTKKIKVSKKVTKINKKVQERKKWKPFGIAVSSQLDDGSTISTTVSEPIFFERVGETALQTVQSKETQLLDKLQSQLLSGVTSTGSKAYKPPSYTDNLDELPMGGSGAYRPPQMQDKEPFGAKTQGKYVPPSQRGAAASSGGFSSREDEDKRAVRVSNLGDEVTERDLRVLFGRCGPIERCFLATDRYSRASKGFAYITFADQKGAESAIAQLNGKGLDHLIISVEWAKPSKSF